MASNAKKSAVSALDQLKAKTTVVADTGDFEGINLSLFYLVSQCETFRVSFLSYVQGLPGLEKTKIFLRLKIFRVNIFC